MERLQPVSPSAEHTQAGCFPDTHPTQHPGNSSRKGDRYTRGLGGDHTWAAGETCRTPSLHLSPWQLVLLFG
jgi:hypothetical protein